MGKAERGRSRTEITDQVEQRRSEMQEKADEIDEVVSDSELERETLESLSFEGTYEGATDIRQNIEQAQEVSSGEFDQESGDLEQIQNESEQTETDLEQQADNTGEDQDRIEDARHQLRSESAGGQLEQASDAAREDIEFLKEQEQRALQARQESERLNQEQQRRIENSRRSS